MKIEFIYTFADGEREQEMLSSDIKKANLKKILKSEKSLKRFALDTFSSSMPEQEDISKSVLKISTCVYLQGEKIKCPKWFSEAKGKLFFEKNRIDNQTKTFFQNGCEGFSPTT